MPGDPQEVFGKNFQPLPVRPRLRSPIAHFEDEPRHLRGNFQRVTSSDASRLVSWIAVENNMEGYWWRCQRCRHEVRCEKLLGCGLPTYVRDQIIERDWNQSGLKQKCPKCQKRSLLITYEFPRIRREIVSVLNIVGLRGAKDSAEGYVPMMWVSRPNSDRRERWFHFNYMIGRNPYGLYRAAVFSDDQLRTLACLYKEKTGHSLFS